MNVGRYYGGYNTHYYVGLANWDGKDLTSLAGKTSVSLALSVQNFVDPVFTNGNTNSQPSGFTYPLVGNYTLKIVALSGTPNFASMSDGWVRTNLVTAPAVGSVTLTSAGYTNVNIGNVVSNWIAAGSGPRWLAFLGTIPVCILSTQRVRYSLIMSSRILVCVLLSRVHITTVSLIIPSVSPKPVS